MKKDRRMMIIMERQRRMGMGMGMARREGKEDW